jgi:hypothetical protein
MPLTKLDIVARAVSRLPTLVLVRRKRGPVRVE